MTAVGNSLQPALFTMEDNSLTGRTRKGAASDHLANERTFLAWIRTSIALMGFGFVVVKFSLFIRQLSFVLEGKTVLPGKGYSPVIGISLVVIGAVVTLLAFVRYRHIERQLAKGTYFPSFLLSLLLTLAIVFMSLVLLVYLLPNI
jgi:putative membrane protein